MYAHVDCVANAYPTSAKPTKILAILSVSPTLHVIEIISVLMCVHTIARASTPCTEMLYLSLVQAL